jgi:hypothetical protein
MVQHSSIPQLLLGPSARKSGSEYSRFATPGRSQDDAIGLMRAKRCNFAKSAAIFQKLEQARFSMCFTSGLNVLSLE